MSKQRLINKDDLIAFIKANGYVYANTLETFPEVDAESVVRCGECRHSSPCPTDKNKLFCLQGESGTGYKRVNKSHYCSYGERESEVSE